MDETLLRRLVDTPGISGYEEDIQALVAAELKATGATVRTDRLGNVIAHKPATNPPPEGRAPRVVLAAHADEIGMVVKHIESDGYLRVQRIGGLFSITLSSQVVIIHGKEPVRGVIAPDLSLREGDKIPAVDDLLIDTGRSADELRALIEVGDPITLAQGLEVLNEQVYLGRNFDDRIGTYCLIEAMRRLGPTACDIFAVSTVQEEVGIRGMPVAAYALEPDMGLAIDGSMTRAAHIKPHQHLCELGKGTGIYLIDGLTIGDRRLTRFLCALAERHQIAFQKNLGGGTDAAALQRTRTGALATTIGAPVRYMHSSVQLCHKADIEATVALLRVFCENAHTLWEQLG